MRRADLRALRGKYERMLTLRLLHARAREDRSFEEPDPRQELASLAAAFPGALREIDELSLATIRARIDALLAAERAAEAEPWMEAWHLVHVLARGALATKRWLGKRRAITLAHREAFQEAIDAGDLPRDALAWEAELAAIARPPRGRVMDLVYVRAAAELGVDVARVRALTSPSKKKKE
ncbi:MAG TPA: hypothetical protein VIF62_39225 [Labilithrix sp.]|jgi:hypothetical protein